jgi:hypothetical protein
MRVLLASDHTAHHAPSSRTSKSTCPPQPRQKRTPPPGRSGAGCARRPAAGAHPIRMHHELFLRLLQSTPRPTRRISVPLRVRRARALQAWHGAGKGRVHLVRGEGRDLSC